MICTTLGLWQR